MGQQRRAVTRRNRRVERHIQLVEPLVRHYSRCTAECPDDLRQVALEGLIRAAERFKGSRSVPFAAFARLHIRGALLHYLRDYGHLIRIPRRVQEQRGLDATDGLRRVEFDRTVLETIPAQRHLEAGVGDDWPGDAPLQQLLRGLNQEQRHLVEQVVLKGHSLRAVAQARGTSASTVHRHLHEALQQLRPLVCPAFDARGC
jgi:RNA polymerase sigma-B factor